MRTGTNIVSTALDEIFFTARINGKEVNPLRARGLQRLTGMANYSCITTWNCCRCKALNDVSDED